jgi:hypothetical protein
MEEITNEYYMKNPAPFEKDSDLVKVTGVPVAVEKMLPLQRREMHLYMF